MERAARNDRWQAGHRTLRHRGDIARTGLCDLHAQARKELFDVYTRIISPTGNLGKEKQRLPDPGTRCPGGRRLWGRECMDRRTIGGMKKDRPVCGLGVAPAMAPPGLRNVMTNKTCGIHRLRCRLRETLPSPTAIYENGSYNVARSSQRNPASTKKVAIAASPKFEARPSIVYDPAGRLWIAYEEGPEKWGKDYGALVPAAGNPLYNARSVRVVCLARMASSRHRRRAADFHCPAHQWPDAARPTFERRQRYAYPKIGIDGKGRSG